MFTILTHPCDIRWFETHCQPEARECGLHFVILYGHEDSPSKIEGWRARKPLVTQPPDYVWARV